jgi:hypothetical protein
MDTQTKKSVISSMIKARRPDLANHVSKMTTAAEPTSGHWVLQERSDAFVYAFVFDSFKHGGAKAVTVTWYYSGRKPKKAKIESTRDWHPQPKPVKKADVPKEVVERVEDKIGNINVNASAVTADAKLATSLKSKINKDLIKAGLDGNGRFRKVGEAINVASGVLQKHGLEEDDVFSADRFRGDSGTANFHMAFTNTEDPFSPEPITNSMLAVQWHFFAETSRYEVLMYMS